MLEMWSEASRLPLDCLQINRISQWFNTGLMGVGDHKEGWRASPPLAHPAEQWRGNRVDALVHRDGPRSKMTAMRSRLPAGGTQ
jgi:hypothetical protein